MSRSKKWRYFIEKSNLAKNMSQSRVSQCSKANIAMLCCQVFSRASDQESCGWWRAIVKMIKGDFHVVEYLGWETTYTEIVPSDRSDFTIYSQRPISLYMTSG